ncbi:MAG: hypothetical protein WBP58_17725 [Chitinophagaceae bacterium]
MKEENKTTNKEHLFHTVTMSVAEIENELSESGKGIFFAPELYIAFKIGLNIYKNRNKIFNGSEVEWLRETSLIKGTITDIAFLVDGKICVLELKVESTHKNYEADLNKLLSIVDTDERYFIALIDCFLHKTDERLPIIENFPNVVSHYKATIPTTYRTYKNPVNCEIHMLHI